MKARIVGLGTYYPDHLRGNDAWPTDFGHVTPAGTDRTFNDIPLPDDEAAKVTARHLEAEAQDPFLGCETRHVADPAMTSAEAEAIAGKRALDDAGVAAENVDYLLSYTMTSDIVAPSGACRTAHLLGAARAIATGMESACATPVIQLATAAGLIEAGLARTVLITTSHLLLRMMPMLHPAMPGLGDGAAACVVTAGGNGFELLTVHGATHGEFYDSVVFTRSKDDPEQLWWKAGGDFRLGSRNGAGAKYLMQNTVSFGVRTLRETCAKAGIPADEIDLLASVQPRGWVPPSILECLGLPPERAVTTYRRTGHLGGVGVLGNLHAAREERRIEPGMLVALYAQGAGFTRTGALLRAPS